MKRTHRQQPFDASQISPLTGEQSTQQPSVAHENSSEDVLRSEVNFLVLPFFALSDKEIWKRTRTTYHTVVERDGQKVDIAWKVVGNQEYGYPGPFDRQVHRAVEQMISSAPFPVTNPVPLGPIYRIVQLLGLRNSGETYRDIKKSLKRIVATTIETKGAYYHKERRRWMERTFHLYDDVVFLGEDMPSGEVAETNYLILGQWYLDNLNARYVKPLDYVYYRSFRSHAGARLYELLGVKFYGMRSAPLRYRYSTLCQLLPITRQQYLSAAKRKLQPAHDELVRTDFLADVVWEEIPVERGDWYVSYWPGRRAKEEQQWVRQQREQGSSLQEASEVQGLPGATEPAGGSRGSKRLSQRGQKGSTLSNEQQQLVEQLVVLGVTKRTAGILVRQSEAKTVQAWLEVVEESDAIDDRPAYLVKALREAWAFPEWFTRRQAEREDTQRQEEAWQSQQACPRCQGTGYYRGDAQTVVQCDHHDCHGEDGDEHDGSQRRADADHAVPGGQSPEATVDSHQGPASPELDELWQRTLAEVERQIPRPAYETLLRDTRLLGLTGEIGVIEAQDTYAAGHLQRQLAGVVAQALGDALGWDVEVRFVAPG